MPIFNNMSPANNGFYNKTFAKLVGLQTAIYWGELEIVLRQVMHKTTYDNNGYFTLDRKYITEQTTLTEEQQFESDLILSKLGIVDIDPENQNRLVPHSDVMYGLVASDDAKMLANIQKSVKSSIKSSKSGGKRAGIISRLKSSLVETDVDLLQAYKDWIDVVYDKGVVKTSQVDIFRESINSYTDRKDVKLSLIKIAICNSYREAAWAISIFEKQGNSRLAPQKVATAYSEITF